MTWFLTIALRISLAAVSVLGIWQTFKLTRADFLFRRDTKESVQAAVQRVPEAWPYYLRLAQLDKTDAAALLTRAKELNPYDTQAYIELALQEESEGNNAAAEKSLLSAFKFDRTYLPRWNLAGFYLRQGNAPAFWMWARKAAEMPAEDIAPLFDLCWHVAPYPETIRSNLQQKDPAVLRQFLQFLVSKKKTEQAARLAPDLIATGHAESDRAILFTVIDSLTESGNEFNPQAANSVWQSLIQAQWIAADTRFPNNKRFARKLLPVHFDWSLSEGNGYHSWAGISGLEVELSGEEPDDCILAGQAIVLAPGRYTMKYSYRTSGIAPGTGVTWQLLDGKSDQLVAESSDLSSETLTDATFPVSAGSERSLFRLRLRYHRTLGTAPAAGTVTIQQIDLESNRS